MKKLISWVELPVSDMERAVNFYNEILGLDLEILDFGTEKMACFPNNEGALSLSPGFNPSKEGSLVSFNAGDDLAGTINRLEAAGGFVVKAKTLIEADGRGYFALFIDSEGNKVGLYGDK